MTVFIMILFAANLIIGIFNLIMFAIVFSEKKRTHDTPISSGKVRVFLPDGSEFEVQSYDFAVELSKILKGDKSNG